MAIKKYDLCINPDPEQIIWRYMSLEKFESILKNKALFFFAELIDFQTLMKDPFQNEKQIIELKNVKMDQPI